MILFVSYVQMFQDPFSENYARSTLIPISIMLADFSIVIRKSKFVMLFEKVVILLFILLIIFYIGLLWPNRFYYWLWMKIRMHSHPGFLKFIYHLLAFNIRLIILMLRLRRGYWAPKNLKELDVLNWFIWNGILNSAEKRLNKGN